MDLTLSVCGFALAGLALWACLVDRQRERAAAWAKQKQEEEAWALSYRRLCDLYRRSAN